MFILIDDMGWTAPGCFGSDFHRTPNIDSLAARGMRFTDAYAACTVCSPTRASILTGQYPARLHLTDWIAGHKRPWAKLRVPEFNQQLPHEAITLAEALRPLGYVSANIGKWHLGVEPFHPESQGFDLNIAGTRRGAPPSYFSPYRNPTLVDGPDGEYLTDRLAEEAERFIEQNKDRPFFLYWPHFAVHTPIQAKQDLIADYESRVNPDAVHKNATFAAMVHSVDEAVGRMMAKLDELGIADDTVVIFMSDNGGLSRVTDNQPLRAGKGSAYEGGVRVPMIVDWPGVTRPGSVCHEPVTSVDFYPTMLEMAGVRPKPGQIIDGVSLAPVLRQESGLNRDAMYWHYPHYHPGGAHPYGAIRDSDYRLIEFYEDGKLELYDLNHDLGETRDLSEAMPGRTAQLHEKLRAWRKHVDAQMPTPNPDYDPARADKAPPRRR